jgi:hypothetical protein
MFVGPPLEVFAGVTDAASELQKIWAAPSNAKLCKRGIPQPEKLSGFVRSQQAFLHMHLHVLRVP